MAIGCHAGSTVRVRNGQAFEERSIDAQAYAAYLHGRIYEAKGELSRAAVKYKAVLSIDPDAAAAWVRLGSIYCLSDSSKSSNAWNKAQYLEPDAPELWLAKARCELKRRNPDSALLNAQHAVRFEPASTEATALVAAAASLSHNADMQVTWLWGGAAMHPTYAPAWQAILDSENVPIFERRYAAGKLSSLRPVDESAIPPPFVHRSVSARRGRAIRDQQLDLALELALGKNDTAAARQAAIFLGINPMQLAMRAFSEGSYGVALNQAELILSVDSSQSSAWIVGLLAADRCRDNVRFEALLRRASNSMPSADPTLQALLLDLVQSRAGNATQLLRDRIDADP
jgi:Tfp pilus assembly protein PilF